ncbi:Piso0_004037 [Millerozyma farinosa CBS 7064]|uniref:Piso0_004037 protein n=1 Tax=Pichia sorbitophila (strain ATCC MYA-4447 / BCRC 22081 / CBS 7064 / NBRC 10061 / NRRL Y-12695) TaxID=559304 RepID=G8YA78_PICSO|nr:Piso0_004037 [Millerozyma farinosa CBS 7064]CCE84492.1 Piso0_004037 [Millerozyma farinosa CBS 7064]
MCYGSWQIRTIFDVIQMLLSAGTFFPEAMLQTSNRANGRLSGFSAPRYDTPVHQHTSHGICMVALYWPQGWPSTAKVAYGPEIPRQISTLVIATAARPKRARSGSRRDSDRLHSPRFIVASESIRVRSDMA